MQLTAEHAQEMATWCGGILETKATDPSQPVLTMRPPGRGTVTVNVGEYLAMHPGGWAVYRADEFEADWETRGVIAPAFGEAGAETLPGG